MSFYPPGWDYDRVLSASDDYMMGLTAEQHTTFFGGLREDGMRHEKDIWCHVSKDGIRQYV
ncbi:ABC transporter integral membrane type 1 [Penicillium bovifimosum]|uniref:ABC transporter integral membrane type 1 n=1 Tax=Penicillium bovifimosum TaxID=126998 RepID=A0A9W9HD95_9EURO|nr:ABC transporter integral membrane type 1 [Penicillium bovifimosum]KAJ5143453.1 ABC transporter integral membrane type 1 [Penicillium bovifimosum]